MIGYKMSSYKKNVGVYSAIKTFLDENVKYGWTNDLVANMTTFFVRGVFWRMSFLGNLKPLDKKLDLWRTPNF